jgi:hypothetical protein
VAASTSTASARSCSALLTVTVNPTGRGKVFDRHSVDLAFLEP